jgi:hypothetical protein
MAAWALRGRRILRSLSSMQLVAPSATSSSPAPAAWAIHIDQQAMMHCCGLMEGAGPGPSSAAASTSCGSMVHGWPSGCMARMFSSDATHEGGPAPRVAARMNRNLEARLAKISRRYQSLKQQAEGARPGNVSQREREKEEGREGGRVGTRPLVVDPCPYITCPWTFSTPHLSLKLSL